MGNLGTIMGVRGGLDAIDYEKWRRPIHDFLACSSVVGSLNMMIHLIFATGVDGTRTVMWGILELLWEFEEVLMQ